MTSDFYIHRDAGRLGWYAGQSVRENPDGTVTRRDEWSERQVFAIRYASAIIARSVADRLHEAARVAMTVVEVTA